MGCANCKPVYAERPPSIGAVRTVQIESVKTKDMRPFSHWGVRVVGAWTDDPEGVVQVLGGNVYWEARPGAKIYVNLI